MTNAPRVPVVGGEMPVVTSGPHKGAGRHREEEEDKDARRPPLRWLAMHQLRWVA